MYLVDDRLGECVVAVQLWSVGVDQVKAAVDGAGVHRADNGLAGRERGREVFRVVGRESANSVHLFGVDFGDDASHSGANLEQYKGGGYLVLYIHIYT